MSFKQNNDFHTRITESTRIRKKHPDRIPVIVEASESCAIGIIDKHKYLVPKSVSIGQLVYVIRSRLTLKPEEAIFLFVKNILPPTSASLYDIYEEHCDPDGFLYFTYSGENVFG